MGKYQSGQMGQTVNLLSFDFGGSNPSLPTKNCGSSSVDRALAFQAEGRGFEPRLPLYRRDDLIISSFILHRPFWLSLKPWGIALKFLFLHHENILFPND